MAQAYAMDVLRLIDLTQRAMAHALTLQEMYQENLSADRYDDLFPKHERLMSEKFQLLRTSVENPEAFAKAVASLQKIDPKSRPN
jgi:hypothetical protein